jgi:hypothetical protein
MSEHLKKHEQLENHEAARSAEKQTEKAETKENAEAAKLNVEEVRKNVEELEATNRIDVNKSLNSQKDDDSLPPSKAVKATSLNNYLSNIRSNLSPASRKFSKVIHNQTVETISEIAAKTIVRPYAILLGGIFTLIGSGLYLFYIRHTGYKYNFLVPLILFAGGFIVGLVTELLLKSPARKKRS